MRRTWILVLGGVALVAIALLWLLRDKTGSSRAPPEPTSRPRATAPRIPAKRIAQKKPESCVALPAGGFSCGACRDDADCSKGAGCVVNLSTGRTECLGSDCKRSQDCEEGSVCRVVARTTRDEPLRACVPPGIRSAGTACDPNDGNDPNVSCGAKLVCVDGGCAPECVREETDDPPMCPGSLPCVETEAGWGCTATCKQENDRCEGGKTCTFLSVETPISLCTHMDGANCLGSQGGCPENTDCVVETNVLAERSTFRCYARCDPNSETPECGGNMVCVRDKPKLGRPPTGHCRRGCAPGNTTQCNANERCVRADARSDLWFCSAT